MSLVSLTFLAFAVPLTLHALSSQARAEPRELLLDGEPIGALAVDPPPEWLLDNDTGPDGTNTPYFRSLRAWLGHDGPWLRSLMPHGGLERPSGKPTLLTLGRPLESVPHPPPDTLRPLQLTLETPSGKAIGEFRCPTTELLSELPDGRFRVRLYRTGPSGERYILEGLSPTEPAPKTAPDQCRGRVAWVDTGLLPPDFMRVPEGLPAFNPGPFWWVREDRCVRFDLRKGQLVGRHTFREGKCSITHTERFAAEKIAHQIVLSEWSSSTRSSCDGDMGAMGGSMIFVHRLVGVDALAWRWVIQGPSQDPIAYHPDDVGLWFKSQKACEASLRTPR